MKVSPLPTVPLVFLLVIIPSLLIAQEKRDSAEKLVVHVRTLHGSLMRSSRNAKMKIDSRIRDLEPKLRKLDYQKFGLLSSHKEVVPVRGKRTLPLAHGHTLTLRPLYIENQRVGMWLKWLDGAGMKIIDTRMHFDCGQDMITGTENGPEEGMILAIRVNPAPK